MDVKEVKCPACQNIQKFRVNDKGQIRSSCVYCGWRPGYKKFEAKLSLVGKNAQTYVVKSKK